MNFSLNLICLICFLATLTSARIITESKINHVSLFHKDAPGPLGNLVINTISGLVKQGELFAGWNGTDSFRNNLIKMVDIPLKAHGIPVRDPDATIEANLIAEVKFIFTVMPLPAIDSHKTVAENVADLVNGAVNLTPIPIFVFRDQLKAKITQINVALISLLPGLDVTKSLSTNIVNWVEAALKLTKVDPNHSTVDNVNQLINTSLDVIKFPGFNPDKSLDDNVITILTKIFTNLPF